MRKIYAIQFVWSMFLDMRKPCLNFNFDPLIIDSPLTILFVPYYWICTCEAPPLWILANFLESRNRQKVKNTTFSPDTFISTAGHHRHPCAPGPAYISVSGLPWMPRTRLNPLQVVNLDNLILLGWFLVGSDSDRIASYIHEQGRSCRAEIYFFACFVLSFRFFFPSDFRVFRMACCSMFILHVISGAPQVAKCVDSSPSPCLLSIFSPFYGNISHCSSHWPYQKEKSSGFTDRRLEGLKRLTVSVTRFKYNYLLPRTVPFDFDCPIIYIRNEELL